MNETNFNTVTSIVGSIIGLISIIVTILIFLNERKRKKVITISTKEKLYCNVNLSGHFVFDYSNNDGVFSIGKEEYLFNTKWSKASNISIHAYRNSPNIKEIALLKNVLDLNSIEKIEADFSSRVRTPHIGDVVVWRNDSGKIAITKIVSIKDDSRGDDKDELECEYVILK